MKQCKNILIVEDNQDIRELITDALLAEGFVVNAAENGQEALEALEKANEPTLVLLDLMMPVMSGWEFIDRIKRDEKFSAHRVVTISAVEANESIEDPTPLATAGKIQKPLSFNSLWTEIQKYCEIPQAASA